MLHGRLHFLRKAIEFVRRVDRTIVQSRSPRIAYIERVRLKGSLGVMPSRFVSLVILIYWSIAAFCLLTWDVIPELTLGYPPDLRAIALAGDSSQAGAVEHPGRG